MEDDELEENNLDMIDFRLPFTIHCIILKEIPTANGKIIQPVTYRAVVEWTSILSMVEFIEPWLFPQEPTPKTTIVTKGGVYLAMVGIEEVTEVWSKYKIWESNKHILNFN